MTMPLLIEHFDDLLVTPENAVQLNYAVLQLAIQGKLVEQDSKDESVNSVLKRLQNWNDENFSNSAIELEKPFDIPESWEWRTIGDVCQTTSGGTPSRQNPNYYGGNIPWLKSGELEDTLIEQIEEAITEEGLANSSAKIFPAGTPLIALYGATVGKTGLLGLDAATNQAVCALFPAKEIIDTHYLLKYLRSQRQKLLDISAGGAQPNISQKVIRDWLIPIPPLAEQQRIVARVKELFVQTRALAKELEYSQIELDGLNKSALSHLLASETPPFGEFNQHWEFIAEHFDLLFQSPEHVAPLRQSILELAVRGKLTRREAGDESAKELLKRIRDEKERLVSEGTISNSETYSSVKESEIPFPLPDGWEWARLEEVCSLVVDIAHQMPKSVDNGVKFISAKDLLDDGTINFERNIKLISEEDFENLAKRVLPQRGDIIYSRIGARLGKARVVKTYEKFMVSYSCCIVRPFLFDVEYLNFYLDSGIVLDQAQVHTKSIGVPDLGMKKIKSFLIAVPPLQEQQRIVTRANELKSLCDALEARLQSAEEERGRLVASVMAGVGG